MSQNTSEIPFTELVERAKSLARVGNNSLEKIRGVINDVYTREMPSKFDWNFLMAESSLTTVSEVHDGTVTATTGDTEVIFSGTTVSADYVGRKIKPAGNDTVYEVIAYNNATSLTVKPAIQGAQNLANTSYSLYKDRYSLAQDFDRFPKPGGVYRWSGGKKQILPEAQYANYINDFYQATASIPDRTRLIGTDTKGCNIVELVPAPRDARVYGYDYIRSVAPLMETTQGTVSSITAGDRSVTASGANFTSVVGDGTYFFRVDNLGVASDSKWYRIISIQDDNNLTLATAFANTDITVANYTIARAPEFPTRLHIGVLYGSMRQLTIDQNDPNAQFYHMQYAQIMSDAKKIYVSRPYSQELTGVFEDYRYRR